MSAPTRQTAPARARAAGAPRETGPRETEPRETEPRETAGREAATGSVPDPMGRLREAGERLLVALVDRLAALACDRVEDLADSLERMAADGGPGLGAALGAGKALARGDNPVWGAITGGFAALGTAAKVLIGVVVALAPVLLLVGLVVAIVAALVWAVVAAVRAATG